MRGTLILLPNTFSDAQSPKHLLPEGLRDILSSLTGLIAESERSGRRYLCKLLSSSEHARSLPIYLLNEHTPQSEFRTFGRLLDDGAVLGLISDAGMPAIADPGSALITYLRKHHTARISCIPGPSSIFMALAISGLPSQSFVFHGYLPVDPVLRRQALKKIEQDAKRSGQSQIFIETPYRNAAFFRDCMETLQDSTRLAVAINITFEDESVEVRSIGEWKKAKLDIPKLPAVFIIAVS
jgi:16S rRNA (cytidine1402-2'-O)-methyltransferase